MPSEPHWLKYTGFTSMRELAREAMRNEAMRNDATLRAARLPQAESEIQRTRATARLNPAKRVKDRPNYAESSDDGDDDQSEEEQGDKTDADFVVEDGSNEAMPDADYIPEAESEGGFLESRSEDPEESLHAGLRLEPSAELLPTALPHQLSASLDGFSDFANAMSAGGRLKRLLDPEQQSHQLPMASENPARKRAKLSHHNVGLVDAGQRSQVQAASGQQENDKRNHSVQLMSPARLAITRIRDTATHIDALLEARGDSLGGMEEEHEKLDSIHTYLLKLYRDIWKKQV